MAETKQVAVRVKRQAGPREAARWEEFSLKWRPSMNVIICLRDIAESPVTRDGKKTTPITYDSNCLEEICGSCAMLINGKARMACSALVDQLDQPIRIEPMSKFPLVREDRKSTRLNSSHSQISYAVFCLKKKKSRGDARPRSEREDLRPDLAVPRILI